MKLRIFATVIANFLAWGNGFALVGSDMTQAEIMTTITGLNLAFAIPVIPYMVLCASIFYLFWGHDPEEFRKEVLRPFVRGA